MLLTGESGAGKDVFAAVHRQSARAAGLPGIDLPTLNAKLKRFGISL